MGPTKNKVNLNVLRGSVNDQVILKTNGDVVFDALNQKSPILVGNSKQHPPVSAS
jgi:hypothetical protein